MSAKLPQLAALTGEKLAGKLDAGDSSGENAWGLTMGDAGWRRAVNVLFVLGV